MVVRGIHERGWLSEKGGVQGLVDGNPGIMWGPSHPVMVNRAWNRVDVKVELKTGGAAKGAVVRGLVYSGLKRTVHAAVGGGGACMTRLAQETGGGRMGRRMVAGSPLVGPPTRTVGIVVQWPLVGHASSVGRWDI